MTRSNNIALIWDFDKTLTPIDSTTKVIEVLFEGSDPKDFWDRVKHLKRVPRLGQKDYEHILGADAPIWMYALSREAFKRKIPLNEETFKFIVEKINLYPEVETFLKALKGLSETPAFKNENLVINHFIVSAGLQDLIKQVFPKDLITSVFGCRYEIEANEDDTESPESIPVYCMDETMKTRSIFEISKGTFLDTEKHVNNRVSEESLFTPFSNMIYVGDGFSDVPALALVRSKGGVGIAVYDPSLPADEGKKTSFLKLVKDRRTDFIASADYSLDGKLFHYIKSRCVQICQKYQSSNQNTVF